MTTLLLFIFISLLHPASFSLVIDDVEQPNESLGQLKVIYECGIGLYYGGNGLN